MLNLLQKSTKRTIDLFISISLLILIFPLFTIISVLIYLQMGSPIIFTQDRPGFQGKIFKIYKFRTMRPNPPGKELEDFKRMTRLGSFLRKLSLDEIPQLLNVIKGELSLVGPRPLLVEYLSLYNEEQQLRHEVPPGITGWAQVKGRNALSWEEKFNYDIWYVKNWSLLLDFKILFLTFYTVIKREGVNSKSNVTMEKFKGSK